MCRSVLKCAAAVLTVGILAGVGASASDIGEQVATEVSMPRYRETLVNQLFTRLGDDRGRRGEDHDAARDYIAAEFARCGLQVEFHEFDLLGRKGINVIATQPGTLDPDAQFIIGAHYDSVANPGADDNASGVSAVLEIARVLSAYESDYTIKYMAFDMEEQGLLGSQAYAEEHRQDDIRAMFSLDMISFDAGTYRVSVKGGGASESLRNEMVAAIWEYGGALIPMAEGAIGASDHASFTSVGFRGCLVIEYNYGANHCYHQQCDSVDTPGFISYDYAADITRSVAGWLADVAGIHEPTDCDGNGQIDADEILADATLDCNGNGVLDVCEFPSGQDLNENGTLDVCDFHDGTSSDCNGNSIPDELEFGGLEDCNGNGTPDLCDIAAWTSADTNHNGIPDECEPTDTLYVDDNGPFDPAPGDASVSDPNEDGSLAHPFDSISEAAAAALNGGEIVLRPGTYSGPENREIELVHQHLTLRSEDGPQSCVIDLEGSGRLMRVVGPFDPPMQLVGLTICNGMQDGGGALLFEFTQAELANCVFLDNTEDYLGGGAIHSADTDLEIVNSVFVGNVSTGGPAAIRVGGALYADGGDVTLSNCTFTQNSADVAGGAIAPRSADCYIRNSIVWDNEAESGPQIAVRFSATAQVRYCNVEGGSGDISLGTSASLSWGAGNTVSDPLFARAERRNLRLLDGSPCIDAGRNTYVLLDAADLDQDGNVFERAPLDLDSAARFFDDPDAPDVGYGVAPLVDMGAYERHGSPFLAADIDDDGDVDLGDLQALLAAYGSCPGDTNYNAAANVADDAETCITLDDLQALLAEYGQTGY